MASRFKLRDSSRGDNTAADMKKLLIILMLAVSLSALADNAASLSAASGCPGDEVEITLSLSNSDAVTAIEAKIPLGDNLSLVAGSCQLNSARSNGHTVSAAVVDKVLKIYAYSLGLNAFRGNSGALLTFKLLVGNAPGTFALTPSVVLSNAAGAQLASTATSGSVLTLAPQLTIGTSQINYGHVPIRSEYTANVSLTNSGTTPLTISNITTSNGELSVSSTSMVIAVGNTQSVTVTYSPLKRVPFAETVTIESDAVNAKVYGKWQSVNVTADPYSVNELRVVRAEGTADTEATIVLKMNNMEPIVAMQSKFALPEGIEYIDGSAKVLGRSRGHVVNASMNDGMLQILSYNSSNTPYADADGDLLSFDVRLGNSSGWYWIAPQDVILANAEQENMTSDVYGEYVVIQSPTISGSASLDFGEQTVTEQLTATYQLSNVGQATLVVDHVTFLSEGFSVITPMPLTVEPYQQASFDVAYSTETVGPFATTMNIYSNDPQSRMKSVKVSGRAYSPNSLAVAGRYDREKGYVLDVALNNHAQISAVQFDIKVSDTSIAEGDLSVTLAERLQGFTQSSSKMGDGWYRVVAFNMNNTPIPGNEGTIMTVCIPANSAPAEPVRFDIEGIVLSTLSGDNIVSPDASQLSVEIGKGFVPGDVNGDGRYSILDASMVIAYVLGRDPLSGIKEAADVNGDGNISVLDASLVVSYVLDGRPVNDTSKVNSLHASGQATEQAVIRFDGGKAYVSIPDASRFVAGQLELSLPKSAEIASISLVGENADTHSLAWRKGHNGFINVATYSLSNSPLSGEDIIEIAFAPNCCTGEIAVSNVLMTSMDNDYYEELAFAPAYVNIGTDGITDTTDELIIYAEGHNLVVISPTETTITLSSVDGKWHTLDANAGKNTYPLNPGFYLVNNHKILIK